MTPFNLPDILRFRNNGKVMMKGTMTQLPLTLVPLFERAGSLFPDVEIASRRPDNSIHRYTYGSWYRRSRALAAALQDYGVRPGDRVATLMWNHYAHLEAYFAVPVIGAVLHTLNLRLHPNELAYIINNAGDRVLLVDDVLLPIFEQISDRVNLDRVIVVPFSGRQPDHEYEDYEALLDHSDCYPVYPEIDENDTAGMCYTSGRTGKPKAALYSHRAIALHAYSISLPDNFSISHDDTILPAMSMFHSNACGLLYAAVMNGSRVVLPGPNLQPELILDLLASQQVTLTGAAPTVWLAVMAALEHQPGRWKLAEGLRIVVAGSACPTSLFGRFEKFGVRVIPACGMTEPAPLSEITWCREERQPDVRSRQGLSSRFIEIRAISRTAESLTQSRGDAISSVEIEAALAGHPAVAEAAVISVPHPKWRERPLAVVVLKEDAGVTKDELRAFLGRTLAKWQVPDDFIFVSELPHASTGKLLKAELQRTLREC